MTEPQSSEPEFTPPAPPQRTSKDRRNSLIAAAVGLVVVIFIFGFLLPQVIDYETVFTILKELATWMALGIVLLYGVYTVGLVVIIEVAGI